MSGKDYFPRIRRGALRTATTTLAIWGCVSGCSRGPARIYPPNVDAQQAGEDAVAQLDQDGDGLLSAEELTSSPGIYDKRTAYDKNNDGSVSAAEITQRIGELSRNGMTGVYSVSCRFLLDGAPLSGAEIELIPEEFLGDALQPARGTTSDNGLLRPTVEGVGARPLRGVQPGIYRVAVTGPDEKVTARYGSGERLGLEVSEAVLGTNIVLRLTSQ